MIEGAKAFYGWLDVDKKVAALQAWVRPVQDTRGANGVQAKPVSTLERRASHGVLKDERIEDLSRSATPM